MLKLIKHDLLRLFRNYFILFIVYLVVCLFTPFSLDFVIFNVFILAFIPFLYGLIISIYVAIAQNFRKTMFSREGCSSKKLPFSTSQVLLVKLVAAFIWSAVANITLIIGMSIFAYFLTYDFGGSNNTLLLTIRNVKSLSGETLTIVLEIIDFIVCELMSIMFLYTCVSIVHTKLIRRARGLVTIVLYLVGMLMLNWILSVLGLDTEILKLNLLYILRISANLFLAIIFFFITVNIIDCHLDLDI